jgi:hypothetical protein
MLQLMLTMVHEHCQEISRLPMLQNPFHDTRRFSAMPVLSHVHQLFSTEQCQVHIHTGQLR